jgi:hypothetical protein
MFSGIDDPQMGQVQTLKGLVHRFGYFGSFAEFAFNPNALKSRSVNPNFQGKILRDMP